MVTYGVGVPPALGQFLSEVFGKEGRGAEIDRLVNVRGIRLMQHMCLQQDPLK